MSNTDTGQTAIDKIGDTLSQLAWANDLAIGTFNNPSFSGTKTATINGFIPADHVHPGQEVKHRSFSDPRKETPNSDARASTPVNNLGRSPRSVKKMGKRKRRNFLATNNKVGVVQANLLQGCISNIVDSVEDYNQRASSKVLQQTEHSELSSASDTSDLRLSTSLLREDKTILAPSNLSNSTRSKQSSTAIQVSPAWKSGSSEPIRTISGEILKSDSKISRLKSANFRKSISGPSQGEVRIPVDGDVENSHIVRMSGAVSTVNVDVHRSPGGSNIDVDKGVSSPDNVPDTRDGKKLSNWSTSQLIPMSELCQWDNISDT